MRLKDGSTPYEQAWMIVLEQARRVAHDPEPHMPDDSTPSQVTAVKAQSVSVHNRLVRLSPETINTLEIDEAGS